MAALLTVLLGTTLKGQTQSNASVSTVIMPVNTVNQKGIYFISMTSFFKKKKKLLDQKNTLQSAIASADSSDKEKINSLKEIEKNINENLKALSRKNSHIVWPSCTFDGNKRSTERIKEIVEKLENNEILSADEAKGITGRSLFLDIPYFDFVLHMPTEYLHSACLGVTKKMTELTFNVGENRQRNTTRKLSSPETFNKLIACVLVPREYSRRVRSLAFHVMKGQEFRNLIIVFFPLVIKCIEKEAKERRLWLLLAYMIRVCIITEPEYEDIDPEVLNYCGKQFYVLFEKLFNVRNCTYYVHIIACHLPEMRALGPLTESSAFGFESFYSEVRHSFVPGTNAPLKQVLQKCLMRRAIGPHCCETSIYLSPKETSHESNCYIYTYVNKQYSFFKILSIDNDHLTCYKVGKYVTSFPETPTLKWEKVGVFKAGGISDEVVTVHRADVAGKVIRVDNLFITCPNNVLREK